jgi:hypothetical protein
MQCFSALVLTFVFTSCSNSSSNSNSNSVNASSNSTSKYVCKGGGEVIQGYQLPPCPNQEENDKTLLGIDINDNGVRDDVEIWIYHHYNTHKKCEKVDFEDVLDENGTKLGYSYKKVCTDEDIPYHQIVREIAMQYGRASQIIIQDPTKARETYKIEDKALDCTFYFQSYAKYNNEPLLVPDEYNFYKELDNIQFNTIQRSKAYHKYNFYLSGGVYPSPKGSYRRFCDFDIDALLGK